jgi:hypothetical protein
MLNLYVGILMEFKMKSSTGTSAFSKSGRILFIDGQRYGEIYIITTDDGYAGGNVGGLLGAMLQPTNGPSEIRMRESGCKHTLQ